MDAKESEFRSILSPELFGILRVGLALATLLHDSTGRVGSRIEDLDLRLIEVEKSIAVLLERTKHRHPVKAAGGPPQFTLARVLE